MNWLIILSGFPGSGKTSIAKRLCSERPDFARVGSDDLRYMIFNEHYPSRDENIIFQIMRETAVILLMKGYNVVLDSTAPNNSLRRYLLSAAQSNNGKMLIILDVSEQVLKQRGINDETIALWQSFWEEPDIPVNIIIKEKNETKEDENRIIYLILKTIENSKITQNI